MALILARRIGEKIIIDGRISVWVARINGDTCKIAVDCPREMTVHRQEISERIKRHNEIKPVRTSDNEIPIGPGPGDSDYGYPRHD